MSTALLLTHLQNSKPKIPLPTLFGALSHHLSVDLPSPAPLAAATVSSPFFLASPHTHEKLQGLVSVFRHALKAKRQALVQSYEERWTVTKAIFSRSVQSGVEAWVMEVVKGLQGGRAVLRLSCLVGLLLGFKDLAGTQGDVTRVEDEIVVALAEVMDIHTQTVNASDWEKEFQPHDDGAAHTSLLELFIQVHSYRPVPLIDSHSGFTITTSPSNSETTSSTPSASQSSFNLSDFLRIRPRHLLGFLGFVQLGRTYTYSCVSLLHINCITENQYSPTEELLIRTFNSRNGRHTRYGINGQTIEIDSLCTWNANRFA